MQNVIEPRLVSQRTFSTVKFLCALPVLPLSPPEPLTTTVLFTDSVILPFPGCHRVGIIEYVAFLDDFLYLAVCI